MFHAAPELFERTPARAVDHQIALGRRLVEHGEITPEQLLTAMQMLTEWDTCLSDIVVANGWIREEGLLPYLADHYFAAYIDLEKAPPDFRLLPLLQPAFCLKHAVLPWVRMNGKLVVATSRPQDFPKLIHARPDVFEAARFVIVSEAQLQACAARLFRATLLKGCETRVKQSESCRAWAGHTIGRYLAAIAIGLPIVAAFALSPQSALTALAVVILATQILAAGTKIAAFLSSERKRPQGIRLRTRGKLPKISVLVPLYKEKEIAAALLRRLSSLTYPRALLDVRLVLEAEDDLTKQALEACTLPPWVKVVEVPPGSGLTTKPRAMNYALDFCKGDIVGIWDAEDAPAPNQLEIVAQTFAHAPPQVACLQGVLDYYNPRTNWLSRCFTLEYSMWFRTILRGMSRLGAAVPLGGTTLFLRRDVIEKIGGWDAHNVTEDADLGIRLCRYGHRTELIPTVTQEEANCHFRPWVRQRSRWLKGYMVTYLVHMSRPRRLLKELGLRKFLGFTAIFLSTLSQFLLAPFVWSFWLLAFGVSLSWIEALPSAIVNGVAVLFVGITMIDIGLAALSLRGQNRRWLIPWAITMPIYFTLATLGAYKALFELIVAPFYWDKTQHGQVPEGTNAEYSAVSTQL
ncbi:glycosyltransferase family 2 protein [Cognatishimia maritima]|uniref:Type II secretion system protein GspE N-terminal domain-containing protein n=1 Tax=Cognatishimia maritima TaxID=870908 RepID=A0A1M5UZD2_9RHOB|nr:glycosyltransferase family 2 protein [Cognatishimia maritima]SHH68365.1 hypothetical protein SAMN04488044_3015 [Cognatishimia maritima]